MSTRMSPDGMYYWDGQQWVSTLSHDGRSRWDGQAWVPAGQGPAAPSYYQAPAASSTRHPTSWTRPLQFAVAAWYAISAIYALTIPFWMGGTMTQAINQSIQRQQELNPQASPLPAGFADTMNSFMGGALWVAAIFGAAICLVVIIGALGRWTWMYYVVLVFMGLSTVSLPVNLVTAIAGSATSSISGFSMPGWTYWLGVVFAIPAAALFVVMLIALIKRGPWGMARDPAALS